MEQSTNQAPDPIESTDETIDGPADETIAPAVYTATTDSDEHGGRRGVVPSRISAIVAAIMIGAALFMGGFTLGAHVATTPGTPADEETRFGPFWDVYALIQKDYAGSPKPSKDQLVQGAIKGMLDTLNDPWSYYQPPSDFHDSQLNVAGQGEGIGVSVVLQPVDPAATVKCDKTIGSGCEMAITDVLPGSPAEVAKLKAGDVIAAVNGTSLDGKTVDDSIKLIKGPKGTSVTLGLVRDGSPINITIVRNVFNLREVTRTSLAGGKVAYISIRGINDPAFAQFDAELKNTIDAGQKYLIIDLRGNLGGLVNDAGKLASEFIGSGPIYWQQDADGKQTEIDATSGGRATDGSMKVMVLVDGNTASAAEILAGALQDRGVAKLVGTKTYGKGVAQEWLQLSNNFGGIHLTIARWLTPNKTWIQGKGLQPNVNATTDGARAGTDPVVDAALKEFGFAPETAASPSPAPSLSPNPSPNPSPSPAAS